MAKDKEACSIKITDKPIIVASGVKTTFKNHPWERKYESLTGSLKKN